MKDDVSKRAVSRMAGLVAAASACGLAGWAAAAFGAVAIAICGASVLFAAAVALWNTTPVLFRPDPRYVKPDPAGLRWPEAAPIAPSGRSRRLLFCVHGFPSTPADYRKLIAASEERGWDLAAPLLPGCGTDPRDLRGTEWSQYLAAVRDEWAALRPRYDVACLVGASMGGSLALALAEEKCADPAMAPAAIATIGTPAVLAAWLRHGLVVNPLIYLSRTLGAFVPAIGASLPDPERAGDDGDGDWKGYLGLYPRQSYTVHIGLRAMERRLALVTCPAIVCHARGDRIVDFRNAGVIEAGLGTDDIEAYIANMDAFGHMRHNLVLYDSQRDRVWARILDFFERRVAR